MRNLYLWKSKVKLKITLSNEIAKIGIRVSDLNHYDFRGKELREKKGPES